MATQTETMRQIAPKLSDKAKAEEQKAFDARMKADAATANLETDRALAQSMQAQDTVAQLQKRRQQEQADAAKLDNDSKIAVNDWQSLIDEHAKQSKEGPAEMGAGASLLAAISAGLGAFGSGLTGGPNYALQIIQKAADDRVRKWERQLSESRGQIDAKHNAVAWFRQKGLDARAASQAARQAILDDAAVRGDALMSQYKSEQIQSTWQQTKAALEQQRVAAVNQRLLDEQDKRVVKTVAGPAAGPSIENQIRLEGLKVDVPQMDKEGNVTGSQTLMARSPQDAEKVRQALTIRNQIRSGIEGMRKFMEGTAIHSVGPNATEIETMADDLRTQFAVLRGLGALSDKDYKIASQLGKPDSPFQLDSTTYKLMSQLDKRLDSAVVSELQGRGLLR
jgi:hypothetical protein